MTAFDTETIGRRFAAPPMAMTAERIAAYARATNETWPAALAGEIAPPVIAFIALRPALRAALRAVTPLYDQLKGLHGEQDIRVRTPIVAGMVLEPTVEVVGIAARSSGVVVVLRAESVADGELVSTQHTAMYFRGATLADAVGVDAPGHPLPPAIAASEPDAVVDDRVDEDQPARYAAASGDTGRYHLDVQAAREAGLPGIIGHGVCTLAFAARAVTGVACGGDPAGVRRLAARFAHPLRPGDELATSVWRLGPVAAGLAAYGFEAAAGDGTVVLRSGRVEVLAS